MNSKGLGFRVKGLGFKGLGFKGLGFRVKGLRELETKDSLNPKL